METILGVISHNCSCELPSYINLNSEELGTLKCLFLMSIRSLLDIKHIISEMLFRYGLKKIFFFFLVLPKNYAKRGRKIPALLSLYLCAYLMLFALHYYVALSKASQFF